MQRHLKGSGLSRKRLYIVYGGGNDLIAAALGHAGDQVVDRAVEALRGMLSRLAEQGATDVLVPNLPDVGMTPAARSAGLSCHGDYDDFVLLLCSQFSWQA